MLRQIFVLISCLAIACLCTKVRFDNYRVYTVTIKNAEQAMLLTAIESSSSDYDFWQSPSIGAKSDIMVAPHKFADFEEFAQSLNLNYTIKVENVQNLIDNEMFAPRPKAFGWDTYYNLNEIYGWLDEKIAAFPNILTGHIVGKSYLGREIRAVLLSHKETNPWVFIESNIHAREWITSATATYVLDQLLTSQNPAVKDLAENFNWMIVPVFNVDGFEYSWKTNRLWRKTRQPHTHLCYGADPNRNFDFKWMEIGASADPCSSTYAGPKAFSEPETEQLNKFVAKFADKIKVYFAFHSYGQHFVFPYGNTGAPVENYDVLMELGNKTVEAIAVRSGTVYDYGPSSTIIYSTSGSSVDCFYDELNIKVAYTFEFRDKGKFGFVLPASQILPNCLEILDGLITFVREAKRLQQI